MSNNLRRWVISGFLTASTTVATLGIGAGVAEAGTVTATVSGPLNVRSGPTTQSQKVGRIPNNGTIAIACQTSGRWISGDVRSTAQWDKLTNGTYVSHAYVRTTASIPSCSAASTPAPGGVTATVSTGGGRLNVRSAPTARASWVGSLANGSTTTVVCSVTGQAINGYVANTSQWDQLSSGRYVSHAYVRVSGTLKACSEMSTPSTPAAGPIGGMTNAQFIAASVAPAQQSWREYGVPASVAIAQAIIESGWGRSTLTANDRNYFGIKCFRGSPGSIATGCHTYRTTECGSSGCYRTTASFRVYASITDSFRDHGRFLVVNSRYSKAFRYKNDSYEFLRQVWIAGYATSPTYYSTVSKIIKRYNLTQYDLR